MFRRDNRCTVDIVSRTQFCIFWSFILKKKCMFFWRISFLNRFRKLNSPIKKSVTTAAIYSAGKNCLSVLFQNLHGDVAYQLRNIATNTWLVCATVCRRIVIWSTMSMELLGIISDHYVHQYFIVVALECHKRNLYRFKVVLGYRLPRYANLLSAHPQKDTKLSYI